MHLDDRAEPWKQAELMMLAPAGERPQVKLSK